MPRPKLDKVDRKILAALQADGRMSNVELARQVGLSAPPCLRRVRALEQAGVIRGYHAELAPAELGFNITRDPVHVHDIQATILHLLGLDHERLTFRTQGRDFRLTDVHGHVIRPLLA